MSKSTQVKKVARSVQAQFIAQLKSAVVEKDVEAAYKSIFQHHYRTSFPSPYGSDGYIELGQVSLLEDDVRLLLEVKFGLTLTRHNERAKIVAQSIYYLKKFQLEGRQLPNVIVGGDENEMFTLYVPKIESYLSRDYDWSLAPSSAWKQNEPLYRELLADPNLNVFVFNTRSPGFDINDVFSAIGALAQQRGVFTKLRANENNLRIIFDEFVRFVFGEKWVDSAKKLKLSPPEAVSIFIQSILGNVDMYLVPTKKNILHLPNGREIPINAANYYAFFSIYDSQYSVKEKDTIISIADRLIEEVKRRFHGDFWTPTVWANDAINMMDEQLGEGWRERYVVWDSAAGTKNLTRDYRFTELYSSTIHQAEIDMSADYNREGKGFQYDFLNDDIEANSASDPRELKMPRELFAALKDNRPFIFFTNPPYGQATNAGEKSKAGIADTSIGRIMRAAEYRKASAELYTQFFYRIQKLIRDFGLTNVHIFFFSKVFQMSPVYAKFTDHFFAQFAFQRGFLLNAGEFQGTSSAWGIAFSHFSLRVDNRIPQTEFKYEIHQQANHGIIQSGTHLVRRLMKGESLKDWLYEIPLPRGEYKDGRYPRVNGGFNLSGSQQKTGTYRAGSFGFVQFNSPNVQHSNKYLTLNSTMIELGNTGRCITADNFERACVMFASAKSTLPKTSWIIDKDVFRRPSDALQSSSSWNEFVYDCVIYSLFHRASYQTSLRDFEYDGSLYDVQNEWFFMKKDEIIGLAEKHGLDPIIYDARSSDERFVYAYLKDKELSQEASKLLSVGKRIIAETFKKRFVTSEEHPEWHVLTWDAGFYQANKICNLFKEEHKDLLITFNEARGALESKIQATVYRDGILER